MSNIFTGYYLGVNALLANQLGMQVSGNNIANVNTPGYSRQQVRLSESLYPLTSGLGLLGTGVDVEEIKRMRNNFLDLQTWQRTSVKENYQAKYDSLQQVENVFNDPAGVGLSTLLQDFWNSWQELADHPEDSEIRANLVGKTISLTDSINENSRQLKQIQTNSDKQVSTLVDQANQLLGEIADLNREIVRYEYGSWQANDYRDKQGQALEELSKIVNITAYEAPDRTVSVLIGGRTIVDRDHAVALSVQKNAQNLSEIYAEFEAGSVNIMEDITQGQLGGIIQLRDQIIPSYQQKLDQLAQELVNQVNALHITGYGLDGSTGNLFFEAIIPDPNNPNQHAADLIQIREQILANYDLIAAGLNPAPGDNSLANSIAALQNALTMDGGSQTFDEYYASLVANIGNDTAAVSDKITIQETILEQLKNQQESIAGVSLDEEMTNLLKYQRAYEAAARFITSVDTLSDRIINGMGLVGR